MTDHCWGIAAAVLVCPVHFVSKTQHVTALSPEESDWCAVGTGTGEACRDRSFMLDAKMLSQLSPVSETGSSSCNKIATMKLRKVLGEQHPPDILANFVHADILEILLQRLNLASVLAMQSDGERFEYESSPYTPVRTSCSDVT